LVIPVFSINGLTVNLKFENLRKCEVLGKNLTLDCLFYREKVKMGQTRDRIIQIFSVLDGKDEHDWLIDLSKELGKEIQVVFSVLYDLWREDNEENVQIFVDSLTEACYT